MAELFCDGCAKPITDDNYCTPHEFDCPNDHNEDRIVECECSLYFHAACCPVCNCQGNYERHYGELWLCSSCGGRFCWAEGSTNRIDLCNRCWVVEMEKTA